MRRLLAFLSVIGFATIPATSAVAAPPDEFEGTGTYDCGFPLEYVATGKFKAIEKGDYVILVGPRNVLEVENGETGETAIYRVGGIFKDVVNADGTTTTVSSGRNIILTPNASALLLIGRWEFTLDEEFNLVGGLTGSGEIIDLCEELQ